MEKIRIVYKMPHCEAWITEMPNTNAAIQERVGGYYQVVYMGRNIVMLCNEEGKLNGSAVNFGFGDDLIFGSVVFCGVADDEFCSLTHKEAEEIAKLMNGEEVA